MIRQAMPTPRGVWPQHPLNASSTPANHENGIPHNVKNFSLNSLLNTPPISTGLERPRPLRHNDVWSRRKGGETMHEGWGGRGGLGGGGGWGRRGRRKGGGGSGLLWGL